MSVKKRRLEELRRTIEEVTPEDAWALHKRGAALIDVREPDEIAGGIAVGARHIVRGFLELKIEDAVPDTGTPLLVMCASGSRSLFAAEDLRNLGYDFTSTAGSGAGKTTGFLWKCPVFSTPSNASATDAICRSRRSTRVARSSCSTAECC